VYVSAQIWVSVAPVNDHRKLPAAAAAVYSMSAEARPQGTMGGGGEGSNPHLPPGPHVGYVKNRREIFG